VIKMNKKEMEMEINRLTEENKQLKEISELYKAENAKQMLQLQMLERYANTVMGVGRSLIQEVEALNNATSSDTE
tara:strand:- start:5358 stop:5582 length:225 start_codon:yes stop_codon:yes gene_type:complete